MAERTVAYYMAGHYNVVYFLLFFVSVFSPFFLFRIEGRQDPSERFTLFQNNIWRMCATEMNHSDTMTCV